MKNMFSSMRLLSVAGFVAIAVLLAACSKFNDDNNSNTPVAALMAFNLAPDQAGIGITLAGNNLTNSALAYTNYTGTYQLIYPGSRNVESYNVTNDSSLAKGDYNFAQDKYYSLFVTGANGSYSNVITQDNFDSLVKITGKSHIRYINAIADSAKPTVTIASAATNVFDDNVSFNAVSDFKVADAGNVTASVNNNGNINASRTISLEEGKVYTVLLVGQPGATDSARKVQIKYITNGSLSNTQ